MNDNPHIPFTFVQVDESMYNLTLARIKQLNEENDKLLKDVLDSALKALEAQKDVEALESVVSALEDDLAKAEADRLTLSREVRAWRDWCACEGGEYDSPLSFEPNLWSGVVSARATTDTNGCIDRTENQS